MFLLDNLDGIMGVLEENTRVPWPPSPAHIPAANGYAAYDNYYPLMPKGIQVYFTQTHTQGRANKLCRSSSAVKPGLEHLESAILIDLTDSAPSIVLSNSMY